MTAQIAFKTARSRREMMAAPHTLAHTAARRTFP